MKSGIIGRLSFSYHNILKKFLTNFIIKDRKKLFDYIQSLMDFSKEVTLLDIGGPTDGMEEIYRKFNKVFILNIKTIEVTNKKTNFEVVQGDGCYLPFRNNSVDYIFSNATLEHICQKFWSLVTNEILRTKVKNFFIITPNYYFPLEPHSMLPFFQFVPNSIKHFLFTRLNMNIGHMNKYNYEKISLPKKNQLKMLFKNSNIFGRGFLISRNWILHN